MISVIIPTYNEEPNVGPLIEKVRSVLSDRQNEIIVVDDNSEDGTRQRVREKSGAGDIKLIARERKKGIGSAYKRGFNEARGSIVAQMDADFSHPPEQLPGLIEEVDAGSSIAVGSRYVERGSRNDPLHRRINPLIGSYLYRYMLRSPIRDVTSGFKAYNRPAVKEVIDNSEELPDGFHFQAASLMHLLEKDYHVVETPIDFMPRRAGDPKYQFKDLLKNVRLLLQLGAEKHLV